MIQKDSLVISEQDLLELMRQAFEEGYKGYQESRDSVVHALFNTWKSTYKPALNASSKWAIAQAATTDEASLRRLQGRVRGQLAPAQQDFINEINQEMNQASTADFINAILGPPSTQID